jgi:hypothetical protein
MAQHDDAPSATAVVDLLDEDTRHLLRRLLRETLQELMELSYRRDRRRPS